MKLEDIKNQALKAWILENKELMQPDNVVICDGSKKEYDRMAQILVDNGTFIPLNPEKRPNSYYCQSDPSDVARVEERTFICSEREEDAGPTNNWANPKQMKTNLNEFFKGCMLGRTMYVIPFCMGPIDSPLSQIGIQISDSPYVVTNMHIMTRVGTHVLEHMGNGDFIRCLHSVGFPLVNGRKDIPWPCEQDISNKYIAHFPETGEIWSYGSGYGGNALLGKKCLALRIASAKARNEGWFAEHMLILGLSNPEGETKYMAAAFPSACGKTNLAMMIPTLPGWKLRTIGDDIAWLHFDENGDLRAINPEAGYFGVAPGTSELSNPNALASMNSNSIFTNVALTPDKDVWWEGIGSEMPANTITWQNHVLHEPKGPAAHPNARFTSPATNNPALAPAWQDPRGVKIEAILFGGRRAGNIPLVRQAKNWEQGVFMGSICASEKTAAAIGGGIGELRFDPFSMLPFCGYNMADYFQHWIEMGRRQGVNLPSVFFVNWFMKDEHGKFIWPGFGDNSRVLAWIFERCQNKAQAVESPIGYLPTESALQLDGLELSKEQINRLLSFDTHAWRDEITSIRRHYEKFGSKLPKELQVELEQLESNLQVK